MLLATINTWVDLIGFVLAAGITFGFIMPHFIGSVIDGRVKKHFIDNYWDPLAHRWHDPHTYGYKTPLSPDFKIPVRVWHWVNLIAWMILLVTGLYIRYPWFAGGREIMRDLHYFFMYIITIALVLRLIYLYFSGDWGHYLKFDKSDLAHAPSVLKYYLFLGPPYDHPKKFNAMQRPAYPGIWFMLTVQAISGFIIWRPGLGGPLISLAGGPADLAAWMRLVHNIFMRFMVALVCVHSYLATMEDYPVVDVFWFWREPPIEKYLHEDHGHGGDHGGDDDDHGHFGLDDEHVAVD